MKAIINENDNLGWLELLETFNPDNTIPKLGKRTTDFAAELTAANAQVAQKPSVLPTIEELRDSVAASLAGKALPYPTDMSAKSYTEIVIGGMRCYMLQSNYSATVPTLIMFYGGGFCLNTLSAHKAFMANIAAAMPCNIILPDYPLAPETKAPAVIAQCEKFLEDVLNNPAIRGISSNIILMGWSSGSNLALTTSINLLNRVPKFYRKISQLILLSPWIDLSMRVCREGPYQTQQNLDTIAAGADLLQLMSQWYLPRGCQGDEPEFCPGYRAGEEMRKLPRITVIVGGCEVLLGDGVFIVDKLRRVGVPVEFIALAGQTHNYLVFHQLSLDGVSVPMLVAGILSGQVIDNMLGEDGLGLSMRRFNI